MHKLYIEITRQALNDLIQIQNWKKKTSPGKLVMITRLLHLGWTALSVLISLFTGNWLWYLHAGHSTSSFEGICTPSSSLFTKLTSVNARCLTLYNYLYGGYKVISRMRIQSQDPDTTMLCVSVHSIREFQSLCGSSCYQFLQKHRKPAWT